MKPHEITADHKNKVVNLVSFLETSPGVYQDGLTEKRDFHVQLTVDVDTPSASITTSNTLLIEKIALRFASNASGNEIDVRDNTTTVATFTKVALGRTTGVIDTGFINQSNTINIYQYTPEAITIDFFGKIL